MKIYRIAQQSDELDEANAELQSIIDSFMNQYPELDLWAYETESKIQLSELRLPVDMRRKGIGSEIIRAIQEFAQRRGKPISLSPEPEVGYKKKLNDFYKGHGFVPNRGRNTDFTISDPLSATMYWRPQQ